MPTTSIETGSLHPLLFSDSPFLTSFQRIVSVNPQWQWLKDKEGSELGIAQALSQMPVAPDNPHPFTDPACATEAAIQIFYQGRGGRIWVPTDLLESLLERTDLDESLPISLFRPSEEAIYVAFGPRWRQHLSPTDLPGMLAFSETPTHIHGATPVGCYVLQSRVLDPRSNIWIRNIGIHQVLTVRGDDKDAPTPTYMLSGFSVGIDDENAPLTDTIARAWQDSIHGAYDTGAKRLIDLLAKLLLYRQSTGARVVEHNERTDEARRLQAVGAKKAAKIERRMARLYDWTEVGPSVVPLASANGPDDGVAAHWRRGHFRMQPHGPQQVLRKLIFIEPTIVRMDRLDEARSVVLNAKSHR